MSQGLCPSVIADLKQIEDARQFEDLMHGYTGYQNLVEAIPTLRDLRQKRAEAEGWDGVPCVIALIVANCGFSWFAAACAVRLSICSVAKT